MDWLTRATRKILTANSFIFGEQLYNQQSGAAIGGPASCSYTGVFMEMVETVGQDRFCTKWGEVEVESEEWRGRKLILALYFRFRDDCFGLWRGSEPEFIEFVQAMNSVNPNIKFTYELDVKGEGVNFLDCTVKINGEGFLESKKFRKPNQKVTYLLPSSCHPRSTTTNSVYSLGLRIRRICSDPAEAEESFAELEQHLRSRQYSKTVVAAGIQRAREVTREEALRKVERPKPKKPPAHLVVTYDRRSSPALGSVLRRHHEGMIRRDRRLKEVFPECPKVAFKRGPNIKDLVTRAKLPPAKRASRHSTGEQQNGVTRCSKGIGRTGCVMCPFVTDRPNQVVREVQVKSSGETVKVEGRMTCKSNGGGGSYLYILENTKTGLQYAGVSGREQPVCRFREHRTSIINGNKTVGEYFARTNSTTDDLSIKSRCPWTARHMERQLILKHKFTGERAINKNI